MFNNEVERELFWRVIGELTFRPAIRVSELYESMAEQISDRIRYDAKGKVLLSLDEKSNAYKRMKRLLPLFVCGEGDARPVEAQMSMPKVYREILFERQLHLYNWIAKRYNGKMIDKVLPMSLIKEAAYMDGAEPSLDEICKYYPYYSEKEEKEIDFLEYILLLNIAEVTQYRTQGMLKRLLDNPKDKEKIRTWIASMKESLSSPKMYLTYVDTFFAIYRDIALTEYNKACVEGEKYRDAAWVENPDFLSHRLWKQADKAASDLADIIEEVILLAWNTIENEYHSFDENLEERPQIKASSEETKALAEIYVKIAKTYIDQSIKEVEKILPKIFLRKKKVK